MSKEALIIFTKNPIYGKVKTRLAKSLGKKLTLSFFLDLLKYSVQSTKDLPFAKFVYYSDTIEEEIWPTENYNKKVQIQIENLGERMKQAFEELFSIGYSKCVIIGTDCPYIDSDIIKKAFYKLIDNDVVIGPSKDGGFYLLGVKSPDFLLFDGIIWSTNNVKTIYLNNVKIKKGTVFKLKELEDIDDIKSYENYQNSM